MKRQRLKPPRVYVHNGQLWADIHFVRGDGSRGRKRLLTRCNTISAAEAWALQRRDGFASGSVNDDGETLTVALYAESWLKDRERRGLACAGLDRARLRDHILPALGDLELAAVRVGNVRAMVRNLVAKVGAEKDDIAPRTVRHIYGLARTMFHDAAVEEKIAGNPCILKRGDLPAKVDKDPSWRRTAVFSVAEVALLVSSPAIPADRRMIYALGFLAGPRFGEVSAFRWHHWHQDTQPLGSLSVERSYSTKREKEKEPKTGEGRALVVLPLLATMLERWRDAGWVAMVGRKPRPDDLIVPMPDGSNRKAHHNLYNLHADLERIGLRRRRFHDSRRTFVSLAREAGAEPSLLRWVTHPPAGSSSIDLYTSPQWPALCKEVGKLAVDVDPGPMDTVHTSRRPARKSTTTSDAAGT